MSKWLEGRNLNTLLGLIQIAALIAGLAYGWSQIENNDKRHTEAIAKLEDADRELKKEISTVRDRADAKLEILTRDMGEVKASLREINTNLKWIISNAPRTGQP
ncbi:hypothetical protein [Chelatococcus sp. XZ-Ab1]|uniref:hypothetical protein n=1 Tax=Chelatococcus sp. XZ-Ab1 TaxID=3034027 RepID=UPI0023E3D22D|nr:hypothetical protein [Chelatococcus sp. XZ-Ab1]